MMEARRIDRWCPLLRPIDGAFISAPDPWSWVRWCTKAIEQMEDIPALAAWCGGMGPHLERMTTSHPQEVEQVREAIRERTRSLAVQILPQEDSPE